jgi:uncharacterized protein (DUF1330 family)
VVPFTSGISFETRWGRERSIARLIHSEVFAVVLEFPTMAAARAWYNGPPYREARELRFKCADYRVFLVQGV